MPELTTFDYGPLGEAASVVKGLADDIRPRVRKTIADVVKIGRALRDAKHLVKGRFSEWIRAEFDMSDDSARRFMAVSERFGDREQEVEGWQMSALYILAAPNVLPAFADAVIANGPIPVADVPAAIDREMYGDPEDEEPQVAADEEDDDDPDPPGEEAADEVEVEQPVEAKSPPRWWREAVAMSAALFSKIHDNAPEGKNRDESLYHLEALDSLLEKIKRKLP